MIGLSSVDSDKQHVGLTRFIKFGLVGASNTVVYYIAYVIIIFILKSSSVDKWDYAIGQIAGFVVSVFWGYCLNRKYVFKPEDGRFGEGIIKFYISYMFTGLLLNSVLLYLWVECFGVSKYIAPLINVIFTMPVNYILNKCWTFRRKENA
jgi:putative flippase GtrA